MDKAFVEQLVSIGIINYKKQRTIWEIAKHCASTAGIPMAGTGAIIGLKAGTVTVPGVGTISGVVAGALAGLFAGTVSCTAANVAFRKPLEDFVNDIPDEE